jgi:hypothetical protein
MTVNELIEKLNQIENKDLEVGMDIGGASRDIGEIVMLECSDGSTYVELQMG